MPDFNYSDTDWEAISRLKKWYSGDVHDSMEHLGLWGYLEGISLLGALPAGEVVCGPAVTVLFEPSDRKGEPQDVYHNAIDNTPEGGILVCDASCADGACSGELMSTGAKTRGAAATIVNGTVRDLAQVRALGYPLFGTAVSPVGVTGKKEPKKSQVPLKFGRVVINPGDVIFADIDGVVVIAKDRVRDVADAADELGRNEAAARQRILAGEKLQSIWPA
ncbi:RraA family protein [Phyllobacterium sp. 0TCS1.6C]|uniref:RraA family protein n=1 Tax=unclassified Phyllobacterium TaxID=2638441 RepID=UPI0022647D1E|nr:MULTISPECIES: RraA family protein [unclassified Phyllobacterium]MCX8279053.1 RraA family protein [Phyllobacterium sp. 0TCS1.6C]MCX8293837.1 RraA family protein [Phyllobacterium sp. 0TCS1.6A]